MDIARSNEWEYFFTWTFDPIKIDRTDYKPLCKKLTKWLNNQSQRYCDGQLKYLVVPETHKRLEDNGLHAFHFHGLVSNIGNIKLKPLNALERFQYQIYSDDEVYTLPGFNLGMTTVTKIKSSQRASTYITKYLTKQTCNLLKGCHRHLASKNCNRPKVYKLLDTDNCPILRLGGEELSYQYDYEFQLFGKSKKISYYEFAN